MVDETLYIYLVVSMEATSDILMREVGIIQNKVYFIFKALATHETHYQRIEKVDMSLVIPFKKLES